MFYGLGTSFLKEMSPKQFTFHPAPTAFQILFSRLGIPWHDLKIFQLNSRSRLPFRAIFRSGLAAIYGDAGRSAKRLASELIAAYPTAARRKAAAGIRLGMEDEKIVLGALSQIAKSEDADTPLSLLALLYDPDADIPAFPLGLPDRKYVHYKNMITHQEVRAVALSKLRLQRGVLWDLGAGSGSIALEAAGLCPETDVHAVEKNPERFSQLRENTEREGMNNIHIYEGESENIVQELPSPNRIFVGGGNGELLLKCFELLQPGGRMVATGVMVETISLLTLILPEYRNELVSVNISMAKDIASGGSMFWAENSIMIAVFCKPLKEIRQ